MKDIRDGAIQIPGGRTFLQTKLTALVGERNFKEASGAGAQRGREKEGKK